MGGRNRSRLLCRKWFKCRQTPETRRQVGGGRSSTFGRRPRLGVQVEVVCLAVPGCSLNYLPGKTIHLPRARNVWSGLIPQKNPMASFLKCWPRPCYKWISSQLVWLKRGVCFGNRGAGRPVMGSLRTKNTTWTDAWPTYSTQCTAAAVGFRFTLTVSCNLPQFVGKLSLLSELKRATACVLVGHYPDWSIRTKISQESFKVSAHAVHKFNSNIFRGVWISSESQIKSEFSLF